jgi:nucleoside-diphosphate-sugar epimerase
MYGRPAGRPLTETRDYAARTKKGSCVARWPRSCSPRTGPGGSLSLSDAPRTTSDPAAAPSPTSATATVLGDPDQPHTYTYIPDIGEGPAVLREQPDAPGQVWHLPNDSNTRTTRQLVDLIFQQAGQPRTRLRQIKPWRFA